MYDLIANNENGRIYISNFQIEKLVYNKIRQEYPLINCYRVRYDQSVLTLYIHPDNSFNAERSNKIQKDAKAIFRDSYGVYVEKVDLILK